MKPLTFSFLRILFIIFFQEVKTIFPFIPVLIQQTDEQLFHRHLPDAIHIQFRQYPRNVIQEYPVAPYNIEIFRPEIIAVIV